MSLWIRPSRVRAAIAALSYWRFRAKQQAAMHLWPLLALIERGVNKHDFTEFIEADDFVFWDKFFRLQMEERQRNLGDGTFAPNYYVDPLVRELKPGDYPHRSPNTIRRRTFLNSWHAAETKGDNLWRLKPNFADIFRAKALTNKGIVYHIPVVDLAVWLFRAEGFPDGADVNSLQRKFEKVFPFETKDYNQLFEFTTERSEDVFTPHEPTGQDYDDAILQEMVPDEPAAATPPAPAVNLKEDDPVYQQVVRLIPLGTSGIILRGVPGTGKTWYAKQIALKLAKAPERVFHVQFHPSFGYEDFVEGFLPDEETKSGFKIVDKVFLQACEAARGTGELIVFVIDEINRGDPARIFGEVLTYIESSYRGQTFQRAYSGQATSVPPNVLILGTMNKSDTSLTPLDLAMLRRFDHVDIEPSSEVVGEFLEERKAYSTDQVTIVTEWFDSLNEIVPIGHSYFKDVTTPEQLETIWQHRMLPYCETALELLPDKLDGCKKSFEAMYKRLLGQNSGDGE